MNFKELNGKLLPKSRMLAYSIAALLLVISVFISSGKDGIDYFAFSNKMGYLSFTFISLALIVTPIRTLFPQFGLNPTLLFARRAIGVSSFAFALLHFVTQAAFVFVYDANMMIMANELSGNAITAGFIALLSMFLLAITSTDWAVRKLGKRWFSLHKLVYLAYPLIIYHVVKIGFDFTIFPALNLFNGSFFMVALVTIVLEAARVWKEKFWKKQKEKKD